MLGVLYLRFRQQNRWPNGDSMQQLMLDETIAYWFVRPVSPRLYYLIRAVGDLAYGGMWGALGYGTCLAAGAVRPPASRFSAGELDHGSGRAMAGLPAGLVGGAADLQAELPGAAGVPPRLRQLDLPGHRVAVFRAGLHPGGD
jgi:hypothetical protein